MTSQQDVGSLLSRYGNLIADCDRHQHLGWYPSGGEVYKFTYVPTPAAVDRFGDHVFGGIGFEAPDYWIARDAFGVDICGQRRPDVDGVALERYRQMFHAAAERACRAVADAYPRRFADWLTLLEERHDFGGVRLQLVVNQRTVVTTCHALRVGRRALDVEAALRRQDRTARTLVEIGGGHGRTTRDLVKLLGIETAFYVDLPLNMLLAARYLHPYFGDRVNVVWDERDPIRQGAINILAPWLIDRIDVPIDLLVNFLSFQHMSTTALRFYGDRLIEPRVRSVFHENRARPRERHDVAIVDYPFRTRFTTVQVRETFVPTGPNGQKLSPVVEEFLVAPS